MMKWAGIVIYLISLFLLYVSTDIKVALTLASVSLSVLYVWVVILWMIRRKNAGGLPTPAKILLLVNLAVILVSVFFIGAVGAALLLVVLLVLHGFVLLVRYGLSRGPVAQDADLRLKYFGILLLGFFSLNPLIEGVSTSNWIEVSASVILIFGGYLMFGEVRNTLRGN
ncbi:hypothetical protein [Thermococcus sp. 21S7]|uniref:hypothetical protein n=1 Tax=Thermococcus sp. 21S7 TaxID=1638221 RepID=UPI00143C7E86|nr:hypothetical protein [Thermococcus sp. 21S7]NJE61898.1 hypothetical protein [Thermococcus sp. 21S7]